MVHKRRLLESGYRFSGVLTHDYEYAKQESAEYRKNGYYASVVSCTNEGYEVYIKPRTPGAQAREDALP